MFNLPACASARLPMIRQQAHGKNFKWTDRIDLAKALSKPQTRSNYLNRGRPMEGAKPK